MEYIRMQARRNFSGRNMHTATSDFKKCLCRSMIQVSFTDTKGTQCECTIARVGPEQMWPENPNVTCAHLNQRGPSPPESALALHKHEATSCPFWGLVPPFSSPSRRGACSQVDVIFVTVTTCTLCYLNIPQKDDLVAADERPFWIKPTLNILRLPSARPRHSIDPYKGASSRP